jgi:hypothetical protein
VYRADDAVRELAIHYQHNREPVAGAKANKKKKKGLASFNTREGGM